MNLGTYGKIIAASGVAGGVGSSYAASKFGDDTKVSVATGAAGTVAGVVGGQVAGRYLGPQAGWYLAERQMDKMHANQKAGLLELKKGVDAKRTGAEIQEVMKKDAAFVNDTWKKAFNASHPNKFFVAGAAIAGATLLGFGAAELTDRITN